MKRTTISLPEDLAREMTRAAERRRVSVSEVARDALREHLQGPTRKRLPFVGIGRSGRHDTARRAEEILTRELGDARGR
jgi:Arc/MetJ-type ribon-helix-helix transcriptional regulator